MDITTFCINVKALRHAEGISKAKFAKVLHISPRTLTQIENGSVPARTSSTILLDLSERYGISPSELFLPPNDLPRGNAGSLSETQEP